MSRRNRDDEELVINLYAQMDKMKSQNSALIEKNKELVDSLEKKKREVLVLKRATQSRKVQSSNSSNGGVAGLMLPEVQIDIKPAPTVLKQSMDDMNLSTSSKQQDPNLLEIARKYKERFVDHFSIIKEFPS